MVETADILNKIEIALSSANALNFQTKITAKLFAFWS